MRPLTLLVTVCLLLMGCTTAKPPLWLLYADAKQVYGRMQVQFEVLCDPVDESNQRICAEAQSVDNKLQLLEPVVRAELSKERPDWVVIMQFVQIAIGIATKVTLIPEKPRRPVAPPIQPAPPAPPAKPPAKTVPQSFFEPLRDDFIRIRFDIPGFQTEGRSDR